METIEQNMNIADLYLEKSEIRLVSDTSVYFALKSCAVFLRAICFILLKWIAIQAKK